MPHQCTDCNRAFDDGSKEMLSGCPDCGGTTFQFRPDGVSRRDLPDEEPPEPPEPDSAVARTVGSAATTVRDLVSGGSPASGAASSNSDVPASTSSGADSERTVERSPEDTAQASARSEIVSPDDLPPTPETNSSSTARGRSTPADHTPSNTAQQQQTSQEFTAGNASTTGTHSRDTLASPSGDGDDSRPDISELRKELNDQFESIRVLEPGQYELNLMELFDREEYIIALQEDGKYTIQVPERWQE